VHLGLTLTEIGGMLLPWGAREVGHGGTISAENRQDHRGARFRVMLPAIAARPSA
jgi:hypothetical protein